MLLEQVLLRGEVSYALRQQAEGLRDAVTRHLTPDQIAAVEVEVQAQALDAVVAECLRLA
jgi:hypothetical protein